MNKEGLFINEKMPKGNWDWDLISTSFFYKESKRKKEINKEIILGYLRAAKVVQHDIDGRNHFHDKYENRMTTNFLEDQTCFAFLFLARHTIELSIKYRLDKLKIEHANSHDIKTLWDKIKEKPNFSDDTFDELIDALNCADKDGYGFRYPTDKGGVPYVKKLTFINTFKIIEWTEKLTNELLKEEV